MEVEDELEALTATFISEVRVEPTAAGGFHLDLTHDNQTILALELSGQFLCYRSRESLFHLLVLSL